jgi:hypothetical protein
MHISHPPDPRVRAHVRAYARAYTDVHTRTYAVARAVPSVIYNAWALFAHGNDRYGKYSGERDARSLPFFRVIAHEEFRGEIVSGSGKCMR